MFSGVVRASCAVLDLFYPPDCVACGSALEGTGDARLCASCRSLLPWIGEWQCPRCADELGPYTEGKRACPSVCHAKTLIFRGAVAVCRFEGVARELVHGLKYRSDLGAAEWMGRRIQERLEKTSWFADCTAVVPVPLHWTRRLSRRFNQSEVLAWSIARAAGRGKPAMALSRVRKTPPQAFLDFSARSENVKGAFKVRRTADVAGQEILLVDDVMTTCATAAECARTLLAAGAKRVHVAVFAR
jgi:ComF family protein